MDNKRMKNIIAIGIILSFFLANIPVIAQDTEKPSQPTTRGEWLYVGGNGPGNYTKIQDAINASSDGDTVFVYDDSSPYHESLIINHTITLKGENKNTTLIEGTGASSEQIILITASEVTITGFYIQQCPLTNISYAVFIDHADRVRITQNTFQNNSKNCHSVVYLLNTTYSQISNNTFMNNSVGVSVNQGGDHRIQGNTFIKNSLGISIVLSNGNTIYRNIILSSNHFGIICELADNNAFAENIIKDNDYGFATELSCRNMFYHNTLINNTVGMSLIESKQNTIKENNFINNSNQSDIKYIGFIGLALSLFYKIRFSKGSGLLSLFGRNHWEANYWSDWKSSSPKPIDRVFYLLGLQIVLGQITDKQYIFHIAQYDWHPAQEPYSFEGLRKNL